MRQREHGLKVCARRISRIWLVADERGSGLVEYAIIFVLFMTMLLGIADFGRLMYAYHFASNASREATRYAAVRGSTCAGDGSCTAANSASGNAGPTTLADVTAFVKNVPLGLDPANVIVTVPAGVNWPANNKPGDTAAFQVEYDFSFVVPFVAKLINGGNALALKSTSEMIISH